MQNFMVNQEDVTKIHEESLKILETVGVQFENNTVLDIFKKNGVKVEGNRVYLNKEIVENYLKLIPSSFMLKSSKGNSWYGKGECHKTPVAGNIYIQDDGVIRKMTNEDVINQFKLSDTSDVIDTTYFNNFLDTQDFSEDQKIFSTFAMYLKYSNKIGPLVFPNTFGTEDVLGIYKKGLNLLREFENAEKEDYLCMISINTLSPLCYDHDPLERLLFACEENQPVWISPCGMPLLTAPPSVFGMMVMTNAEVLAGLVLVQMIKPGLPCVYGNTSGATNLRTIQLSIGSPEAAIVTYLTKGLADFYQLPCRAGGGLSDAKDFDFQAGAESMMMLTATLNANPDFVFHACGCMGSFNVVSFEKFLADEEVILMHERIVRGADCSDEKGCFESICEVGPRGTFLKGRTPKMFKEEFVMPKYFDKDDPNQWQQKGAVSLREVIKKDIQKRLKSYKIPEITKEQEKLLLPYIPKQYREII